MLRIVKTGSVQPCHALSSRLSPQEMIIVLARLEGQSESESRSKHQSQVPNSYNTLETLLKIPWPYQWPLTVFIMLLCNVGHVFEIWYELAPLLRGPGRGEHTSKTGPDLTGVDNLLESPNDLETDTTFEMGAVDGNAMAMKHRRIFDTIDMLSRGAVAVSDSGER